jgi:hypothetical protein
MVDQLSPVDISYTEVKKTEMSSPEVSCMPLGTLLFNHKTLSLIPRPKPSAIRFRSKKTKRVHPVTTQTLAHSIKPQEAKKLTCFP